MSDSQTSPLPSSILIVDDNRDNLRFLTRILVGQGYIVRPTPDSSLALSSVRTKVPDLILLDIKMPGMSGYDVCKQLKADERTRDIPVIFISALSEVRDKVKAFSLGGVDYISKPFHEEEVVARIRTHLTLRNLQMSLQEKNACLRQEILERARAEEELRESKERVSLALDISNAGIWDWNIRTDEVFADDRLLNLLEYEREEFPETLEALKPIHHPDEWDEMYAAMNACIQGKTSAYVYEHRLLSKSGKWKWIFIRAKVVRWDKQKNPERLLGTVIDITSRKKTEAEIRQTHKMEAIGTLASGIAHDFNNILSIILGNAELALFEIAKDHPVRLNLEEMRTASLRAKELIQQILSFSRRAEEERRPMKISPVIKESLKLLRSFIPANIDIHLNIADDADTVMADPTRIHQIIINLSTNAVHAMAENGGILTVSLRNVMVDGNHAALHPNLTPGRYVRLSMSDTGHGFPPEDKDRIFDPYFTTKEIGKGTGMGLAVVHGIVKTHGGEISAHSELGKGSVFSLFFPAIEAKGEAMRDDSMPKTLPTGKERILIVDDEEYLAKLRQQSLERLGYQVDMKTDPSQALDMFCSDPNRFDLVVTDMMMPHMTGDLLAKRILRIRPNMPIILCTGFSEKISEEKAKSIGVREYVEKPISYYDFAKTVRRVLDES